MGLSIKEKVLIGVIASAIVLAIGGSVWALVSPNNDKIKNNDETSLEKSVTTEPSKEEEEPSKESTTNESNEDTTADSKSNTGSTPEPVPSHNETSSKPPSTQARKQPVAPSRPQTTQKQPQKVSCNESMKASYTSLYNSQISAENASWSNRVNQWGNEASARGMSFSGYVQDKINQNKPAHDARIASINSNYQSNLSSVSCN